MMNSRKARHVLITGASTGIGEACVLDLAARGWRVFAGVRREQDGDALVTKAGPIVTPILLDVTRADQIAAAVDQVRGIVGDTGISGLVNNAGVVVAGPIEFVPIAEFERQFQVNVLGVVAVTQAFLPLVRAACGRLVIMGSTSGFWCEPFVAPYGASKFALEAIADSLRIELATWRIEVALVQPGMTRTSIWEKSRASAEQLKALMPPQCETLYGQPLAALRNAVDLAPRLAAPPDRVARAVRHALEARRPRTRYPVGFDAHLQAFLARWIPDRFRDRLTRWVMKM